MLSYGPTCELIRSASPLKFEEGLMVWG